MGDERRADDLERDEQTPAGAQLDADEGEPDIEPFATGGEPTDREPQHGYGYE